MVTWNGYVRNACWIIALATIALIFMRVLSYNSLGDFQHVVSKKSIEEAIINCKSKGGLKYIQGCSGFDCWKAECHNSYIVESFSSY